MKWLAVMTLIVAMIFVMGSSCDNGDDDQVARTSTDDDDNDDDTYYDDDDDTDDDDNDTIDDDTLDDDTLDDDTLDDDTLDDDTSDDDTLDDDTLDDDTADDDTIDDDTADDDTSDDDTADDDTTDDDTLDDDTLDDDTTDDDTADDDTLDDDTTDDDTSDDDTADDDTLDDDTTDDDTTDDDTADDDTMEPTVESITPDSGHNFYAVPVTIVGTEFTDHIDKLYLDDFELTNVQIVSDTQITAAAPSGLAGGLHDLKIKQGPRTFTYLALYTAIDDYTAYAMIDGFVYDPDGVPLSNLSVYRSGGLFSTTTLVNGFFVLPVLPGTGNLMLANNGPANAAAPQETIKLLDGHVFADDESFDFDLEYYTLSGTVSSADDGPVDNVGVQVFPYENFTQVGSVRTDVNGAYSMPLYANTYSVSAVASDDPELAPLYTEQYAFTGDQTLPLILNGGYILSGRITDRDGSPMPNISVSPHLLANHMIAQVGDNTDADGHYSIHLQPGEYTIMLSDFSGAYPDLPKEGVYFVGSTIVAGDTTFDYQFDYEIVDVTITLGGEMVDFDVEVVPEGEMGPMSPTTIEAGMGSLSLRPGTYFIHLVPPYDEGAALTTHSNVAIGDGDLLTFALDAGVALDGVIQDQDGGALSYMRVCADPTAPPGSSSYSRQRCRQIESGGAYSLDLAPGQYNLTVNKYWDLLARKVAGPYLTVPNLGVYADTTYNVIVDLYELSGTVYRGANIATGWRVRITSGQGHNLDTILNPAGQFAVKMPAGFYDIMFYPPSPSTPRPIVARNMPVDESAVIVAHVPTE